MESRGFEKFLKKRTHRYLSGRILIKSDIYLTRNQRDEILKIVRTTINNPYYGCEYQITRNIFYKLGKPVYGVHFYSNRIGILIKIITRSENFQND